MPPEVRGVSGDPGPHLPSSLVLVGAGKMGGAMLEGWLDTGLEPRTIAVLEPQPSPELQQLRARHAFALNPGLAKVAPPSALVLAVKPQSLAEAAPALRPLVVDETTVVSIMAGKTLADIMAALPAARAVVRAMPNLPASIRRGITAAVASPATSPAQKAMADGLLRVTGGLEWLDDERLMDAVTALSGSGPAYVFLLAECMAAAGEAAGLPAGLADRLARATVAGAGEVLHRSDLPAARLRENVTSPGGTTAAALEILLRRDSPPGSQGALEALMTEAIAAAKRRAAELSG